MSTNDYVPDTPTPTPHPCPSGEPYRFDGHGNVECLATVSVPAEKPDVPLALSGGTFTPDVLIGGALLIVLGIALIRARVADKKVGR